MKKLLSEFSNSARTRVLQWRALCLLATVFFLAEAPLISAPLPPSFEVISFSPTVGSCGTTVVIQGAGFTGATAVLFGGTNADSYTVDSDEQITAVVGSSKTGSVTVVNGALSQSMSGFIWSDVIAPVVTCNGPVTISTSPGLCTGSTTLSPAVVNDNCNNIDGNGLHFDGANDYLNLGALDFISGEFTVETWIKTSYTGGQNMDVFQCFPTLNNGATYMLIEINSIGRVRYVFRPQGGGGPDFTSTIAVNDGQWHHLAAVKGADTYTRMYIDGVLTGMSGSANASAPAGPAFCAMGRLSTNSRFFNGIIDEVRIWDNERTQLQIQRNMHNELKAQTGLVAVYHFNDGVAAGNNLLLTSAADSSGNGNDGALTNFSLTGATSNWVEGQSFHSSVYSDLPATYPIGSTTVIWTAIDGAGNTSTCTQTVTVQDLNAPTITCPGNISVGNSPGVCGGPATYLVAHSDDCGVSTLSQTQGFASGAFFPSGITTNTLVATDASGNTASCSFTVTVSDTEAPSMICTGNLSAFASPGQCGASFSIVSPRVTDNCAIGNALDLDGVNDLANLPYPVMTVTNNLTLEGWANWHGGGVATQVIFYNGNTSNSGYGLIVNGGILKVLRGGINLTNIAPMPVNTWTHLALVRNAGVWQVYINGAPTGPTVATNPAVPATNFILGGITGQTFQGGIDEVRVWNVARTQAEIAANMNGTVASQPGLVANYRMDQGLANGNNTGITTVINDQGNAAFDVPISGMALIGNTSNFVSSVPGLGVTTVTNSFNNTDDASGTYPVGTTTVVWTATDGSGNAATCSQTITVSDTLAPVITCPADISVSNDLGVCGAAVNHSATASDNCSFVLSQSGGLSSGAIFPVGTSTVSYSVVDPSGNTAACSFVVAVIDAEAPNALCQDLTVVLDNAGNAAITASQIDNGSSDNCGIRGITVSNSTFNCSNIGVNTVILTVFDTFGFIGNSSTCTATVTVVDNTAPVVTCPADITVNAASMQCNTTVTWAVSATDACGIASTVASPASGSIFGGGTSVVSVVASDVNGNTSSCTFNVHVNLVNTITLWGVPCDATASCSNVPSAPTVIACPTTGNGGSGSGGHHGSGHGNHTCNYENGSGAGHNYHGYNGTVSNPCGNGGSGSGSGFGHGSGSGNGHGGNHGSGSNGSNCNTYCVSNSCGIYATSLCGPCPTVSMNEVIVPGSGPGCYTIVRTWTATDGFGNALSQSQTITVSDNTRPSINCPSNITVCVPNSNTSGRTVTYNVTATDNCGVPTVSSAPVSGSNFPIGNTFVTATASDGCGNTRTCSFRVRVERRNNCNSKVADPSLDEAEGEAEPALSINAYPNPTTGLVDVKIVSENSEADFSSPLTVTDMYGKVILKSNVTFIEGMANITLDLSNVSAGIYMVHVNHLATRIVRQ